MYHYNVEDNFHEPEKLADFNYKDAGDTETYLYQLFKNATDKSTYAREIIGGATRNWSTYYHISPQRTVLVRPFRDLIAKSSILELGAGCGAITRYLGEQGARVIALEGSQHRARVAGVRCTDLPNVKVYCDLIQNFDYPETFDIVTLIGVLEYAQVYLQDDDPIDALLRHAQRFLKPDGVLLLAIENQLGLKYFAGNPEDHIGQAMFGINDAYGDKTPITFGKQELISRVLRAGFQSTSLYLPFPDYKIPVSIICPLGHDKTQAPEAWNLGDLLTGSVIHDPQSIKQSSFSLEMAWQVVARNGIAADLANSFLLLCGKNDACALPDHNELLALHYGFDLGRGRETRFFARNGEIVMQTWKNAQQDENSQQEAYIRGQVWFHELLRILNRPGWKINDIVAWCKPWKAALLKVAECHADPVIEPAFAHFSIHLPGKYIDAAPFNWIPRADGNTGFFDLDWEIPFSLPLEFILFRGLCVTFVRVTSCAAPAELLPSSFGELVLKILFLLDVRLQKMDVENFLTLFNRFQNMVTGNPEDFVDFHITRLEGAPLVIRHDIRPNRN
jgi:2-polyprenyl-3-methyl-5-hydroxy-6-metoxy-1,4-benzoquinol methylase